MKKDRREFLSKYGAGYHLKLQSCFHAASLSYDIFVSNLMFSGPGVSDDAVRASTPFETGLYNAIIAFDWEHCVQVRTNLIVCV